mmetsp:Transcript_45615/g.77500  ORF Transcript_45615/g.77500 Transcript_45615/m.77500 type:complete len:329 (-) Transcript_45615:226-1212(-)
MAYVVVLESVMPFSAKDDLTPTTADAAAAATPSVGNHFCCCCCCFSPFRVPPLPCPACFHFLHFRVVPPHRVLGCVHRVIPRPHRRHHGRHHGLQMRLFLILLRCHFLDFSFFSFAASTLVSTLVSTLPVATAPTLPKHGPAVQASSGQSAHHQRHAAGCRRALATTVQACSFVASAAATAIATIVTVARQGRLSDDGMPVHYSRRLRFLQVQLDSFAVLFRVLFGVVEGTLAWVFRGRGGGGPWRRCERCTAVVVVVVGVVAHCAVQSKEKSTARPFQTQPTTVVVVVVVVAILILQRWYRSRRWREQWWRCWVRSHDHGCFAHEAR